MNLDELERLAKACTPQHIDTSQFVDKNETMSCPWCDGQGDVEVDTYTNYDGVAIGVQFFGVGNEFGNAEKYFRACKPETILALVRVAKAAETDRRIGTQETYDAVGGALSKLTEALK